MPHPAVSTVHFLLKLLSLINLGGRGPPKGRALHPDLPRRRLGPREGRMPKVTRARGRNWHGGWG